MPRAFLVKTKAHAASSSPKCYSPASSSGIASPGSSVGSISPRNDENVPQFYSEPEQCQGLDLSMKSLLKETNTIVQNSSSMDYFQEPQPFVPSYSYPGKFAKIADFLRQAAAAAAAQAAQAQTQAQVHFQEPAPVPETRTPYSINWSEHFSVHKVAVSPTPSTMSSEDSGRGSVHSNSEDNSSPESNKKCRFACSDCNKSYSTAAGLAKHQEFHCSSQIKKSFSCKHCDKVYVSLGALKMHIRTHTLPCKCKVCGKAFSRPWLLQGHIRTHTGEKPFQCQFCKRAFADRSNLRAHLQTHSLVKKYNCSKCCRSFSRMSLLQKHEENKICCRHQQTTPMETMDTVQC